MTSDLWRLSCSEQCTKLTRQALGPLERPEIRQAICMVKSVMLVRIIKIDVGVTWRITAISYFPRYIGNKAHTRKECVPGVLFSFLPLKAWLRGYMFT